MAVIAELDSARSLDEVCKNTHKLAEASVLVERDLAPNKRERKKGVLILKKNILSISKEHKVMVRENRMKIKDHCFRWNVEIKFVSGKKNGRSELIKVYGDKINTLNLKY